MPYCNSCGEHVTEDFARVFGVDAAEYDHLEGSGRYVAGCTSCQPKAGIDEVVKRALEP